MVETWIGKNGHWMMGEWWPPFKKLRVPPYFERNPCVVLMKRNRYEGQVHAMIEVDRIFATCSRIPRRLHGLSSIHSWSGVGDVRWWKYVWKPVWLRLIKMMIRFMKSCLLSFLDPIIECHGMLTLIYGKCIIPQEGETVELASEKDKKSLPQNLCVRWAASIWI